jgi:hypothetical protein
MSTTFGILIKTTDEVVEVAHRYSIGRGMVMITIHNSLVHLLPEETELIPLDNSSQGINTVGDLLEQWEKNMKPHEINCLTCKHKEVSRHVEPCYGCKVNEKYYNYESNCN